MSLLAIYGLGVLLVFLLSMTLFIIIMGTNDILIDLALSSVISVFWFITVPVLVYSAIIEAYDNWKYSRGRTRQ